MRKEHAQTEYICDYRPCHGSLGPGDEVIVIYGYLVGPIDDIHPYGRHGGNDGQDRHFHRGCFEQLMNPIMEYLPPRRTK